MIDINSDHALLARLADSYGTPCFVYSMDEVHERIRSIREAFGGRFKISYAVKANPNGELLRLLNGAVDTLDISSGGELTRGLAAGWNADLMSFTGPAKQPFELQAVIREGVGEVIVESLYEAEMLQEYAASAGVQQKILLRIAPKRIPKGFGINMAGKPSQFGVDEEDSDEAIRALLKMPNLDLIGFHIYSGTQCLQPESIAENYAIFSAIFREKAERHNLKPTKLIYGSGIGIPYHPGTETVDVTAVAELAIPALDELLQDNRFAETELFLETGRYLIGEAGVFVTKVVGRKSSRGTEIAICDGGMNNHLGACGHLGSIIHRNYPIFKVTGASEPIDAYDLVGPLCTSIDTLGHGVELGPVQIGDLIGIRCSGAYGVTASPIYFISHRPPKEVILVTVANELQEIDATQFQVDGSATA